MSRTCWLGNRVIIIIIIIMAMAFWECPWDLCGSLFG